MEVGGVATILAAKSQGAGDANDIYVWRKSSDKRAEQTTWQPNRTLSGIKIIAQFCMAVATIAFICQNFGVRIYLP